MQAEDLFTDDVLAPSRTTRSSWDHVLHHAEVVRGDELLVFVTAYDITQRSPVWCPVESIAPGSAAVYPYRVKVLGRGLGQFSADEVLGWRRPIWLHDVILDLSRTFGRAHAGVRIEPLNHDGLVCEEAFCPERATWRVTRFGTPLRHNALASSALLCAGHKETHEPPTQLELLRDGLLPARV